MRASAHGTPLPKPAMRGAAPGRGRGQLSLRAGMRLPAELRGWKAPRALPASRPMGRGMPGVQMRVRKGVKPLTSMSQDVSESTAVDQILDRMREALKVDASNTDEVVVSGTGVHLGMDVAWELRSRPDGAFMEELRGEKFSYRESSLLCTWVRSGHWLLPGPLALLEVSTEEDSGEKEGALPRAPWAAGEVVVNIAMRGGRVTARVVVNTETWEPEYMLLPVCGDLERWTYFDWAEVLPRATFPLKTEHSAVAGGRHVFDTKDAKRVPLAAVDPSLFFLPAGNALPSDTTFDHDAPGSVPIVRTRSGHVLVKPKVNGEEIGLFILDTGASGFVITPRAAEALGMEAFGELFVSGVGHKVRCQFRRGSTISIGAVHISEPLFMEMELTGVVTGAPEPVVGIIGFELFRRTVVELPARPGGRRGEAQSMASSAAGDEQFMELHDPAEYDLGAGMAWEEIYLVANVPHLRASFRGQGTGREHSELFMIDSGAGGAESMFHARAVKDLGLLEGMEGSFLNPTARVRGVGGSQNAGIKVTRGKLPRLSLSDGACEWSDVTALYATCGGLDLSLHTCGMLCGDLLSGCDIVWDYSNKRAAFRKVPEGLEKEPIQFGID